jgi:hypothetical protein
MVHYRIHKSTTVDPSRINCIQSIHSHTCSSITINRLACLLRIREFPGFGTRPETQFSWVFETFHSPSLDNAAVAPEENQACLLQSQTHLISDNHRAKTHRMLYNRAQVKKIKFSLCLIKYHSMKTYWRSGDIAPLILELGNGWRWVISFTSRRFYPRCKSPLYPLDRRPGGPQSRSRHGGKDEESHHRSCREMNPGRPARSLVSILTEIPWLRYMAQFVK